MPIRLDRNRDAVFAVDVQKGFMPGEEPGYGELPAPDGAAVAAPLAQLAGHVDLVIASGDAHTPDHSSFVAQGGPWPVHCVAGTLGAELHPLVAQVLTPGWFFPKGITRDTDAYSAFQATDLAERLRAAGIERLLIGGLVTNVCVRLTALDALEEGFDVIVVTDACRAIAADGLPSGDDTFTELRERGAVLSTSGELI
jgi:nicotinamidase/pyrazinamidase